MNQRIQELAQLAGIKLPVGGFPNYDEFDFEKFAELIVSQCIFEVMHESTKEPSIDIQNFSVTVANRIKKHFGIKK